MNTISARGAAVSGARHLRMARNGQDAVATWTGDGAGAIVVCDGCSAGHSSEVGARLGAQLVIAAVTARLRGGESPGALWAGVRAQVAAVLGQLAEAMPGDRAAAIREHFLFTIVAAVAAGGEASVWAIGDGAYAFGDRMRELGPFTDNQPPYLAYDLLGMPQPARLETIAARAGSVMVATDGAAELGLAELAGLVDEAMLAHADGLRRRLTVLARGGERVDWEARRVVRTPAALQDDGAIAVLRWQP
ncbi:MAG TPA: protein phosphatase 2C domain-containing protein [Kofleriaceae bacterium]|nr:protein phosphatase 2C domain-containing protein [Kofleriaceae bacterium]